MNAKYGYGDWREICTIGGERGKNDLHEREGEQHPNEGGRDNSHRVIEVPEQNEESCHEKPGGDLKEYGQYRNDRGHLPLHKSIISMLTEACGVP